MNSISSSLRLSPLAGLALLLAPIDASAQPQDLHSELREKGPLYCGTIRNPSWAENTTMKGLVVKLGTNDMDFVCYDEDLLRVSLLWTGAFMNFPNKGREQIAHPPAAEIAGVARFGTRPTPGWARRGVFADPRLQQQGPLPRDWAHYRGAYLHGNHVVVSYTVAGVGVLELPDLEIVGEGKGFTRTLAIDPSREEMTLLVAESDTPSAPTAGLTSTKGTGPDALAANLPPTPAAGDVAAVLYSRSEELTVVKLVEGPPGTLWKIDDGNRLTLQIPAHVAATTVKLLHWTGSRASWKNFQSLASASPKGIEISTLTHGGPRRWTAAVQISGIVGSNAGPYQVDNLGEPVPNPWGTKNFLSGFDFFPDGRAAVGAFHGDVWMVNGLDAKLDKIQWRRIASGLFQPLGLKIVDGRIYVTCRDGIIRLEDLNGDGEADYYESFNHDTVVTPNYHEFCLDLQTDSAGNFYYAKGAPWPPDVTSPHQGTMLKVSKDGSKLEVIATGLRAPNGLGMGPHDELTFSDNEGHYIPTSKISLVKPGNPFYGMVQTAHRPSPTTFEQPICWIPKVMDNSSGGQVWVPDDRWGPLKNQMLFLSYGKASLFSVMQETVDGALQGGVVPFPFKFSSGVMRARFNPLDGQLYLTGLRGWQTDGVRDGGFFRVRYTGQPVSWPTEFHARKTGVEIVYSSPLSAESAKDVGNWAVDQWNYIWSPNYGSPEVSTTDPRVKTHEQVEVTGVTLSEEGRKVFLQIPTIKPVMQMRIRTKATAADGGAAGRDLFLTLHKLAD